MIFWYPIERCGAIEANMEMYAEALTGQSSAMYIFIFYLTYTYAFPLSSNVYDF